MTITGIITFILSIIMMFSYLYVSYRVVHSYREQGRWGVWAILNILSIAIIVAATEVMSEVVRLC